MSPRRSPVATVALAGLVGLIGSSCAVQSEVESARLPGITVNSDPVPPTTPPVTPRPTEAPPTTTAPPTTVETTVPAGPLSVTDTLVLDQAPPGSTLDVRLPITDSASMNDVVQSWAATRTSAFAASASVVLEQYADQLAQIAEYAAQTTVPETTEPIPPPPVPALSVAQADADPDAVPNVIRLRVEEDLGAGPVVSYVSWYQLPNAQIISGVGLIRRKKRQAFLEMLQGQVPGAKTDQRGWSTKSWEGLVFGSILADVQLGTDGSLTATIAPELVDGDGSTLLVRLNADTAESLLTADGDWLISGNQPAWTTGEADCAELRCVALTFDDGPSPDTDRLLGVLDHVDVTATFFMIGKSIRERPETAAAVAAAGHQIGNHTWSHQRLGDLSPADQQAEVNSTEQEIAAVTGIDATLLRPPYGAYNDGTRELGMGLALWSVDTNDWRHRNPSKTVKSALSDTKPGSVVLMHDLFSSTVDATAMVVAGLRGDGYRFVTMDHLLGTPEPGTLYYEVGRSEVYVPETTVPATTEAAEE